jgi:hypothetical protein
MCAICTDEAGYKSVLQKLPGEIAKGGWNGGINNVHEFTSTFFPSATYGLQDRIARGLKFDNVTPGAEAIGQVATGLVSVSSIVRRLATISSKLSAFNQAMRQFANLDRALQRVASADVRTMESVAQMSLDTKNAGSGSLRQVLGQIWDMDPRARGKLVESVLSGRDYHGWQWVGKNQGGMNEAIDFFKDGIHVDVNTLAGKSLTTVKEKLKTLNELGSVNPTQRFLLDIRVPDAEAAATAQAWANSARHGDNVGITVKVMDQ